MRMKRCSKKLSTAANLSAGHTLPVATQNVLAAHTAAIPIPPHADIDIPPAGSATTIDIDIHPGAPVGPVSVAAPPADVDIDIATLLRPRPVTPRTFVTRAHLCATIPLILRYASIAAFFLRCALAAVLAASARIGTLCTAIASARSFLFALLDLQG